MLLIMTTVAVNLASNDAVLQQAAAQDLASLLRHTRSMALLTQKETVVLFDINEQSYQRSDQKKIYHLPKSVQLSWQANKTPWFHEQNRIRFFADGSSTGGQLLLTRGTVLWQIRVSALTGQVDVQQP